MSALSKSLEFKTGESKYISHSREKEAFYKCSILYIFALYVLPQYFGIPNRIFDLTAVRIMIIVLFLFIVFDYKRSQDALDLIKREPLSKVILPYIIVLVYTMVLRTDINAFFNPFIEILEMYLLIYVIRDSVGTKKTVKLIIGFLYILAILGIIEAINMQSPFWYLKTIDGLVTGKFIRAGNYRIMGNAVHSLGYGLFLVTGIPFSGYDVERNEFKIFRRPVLLFGLVTNVFLTGSRSSLGVAGAELFLMFVLTDYKYIRETIFYLIVGLMVFGGVLFCIQGTGAGQYILLQITSLIDTLFGTTFSLKFGANLETLNQSSAYRDLIKKVFKVEWLNPFLGLGRARGFVTTIDGLVVNSIDNFYIAEYIRYAYPGLIFYVFFLVYMGYKMFVDYIRTGSSLIKMLAIGAVGYCVHLYIADSLMTLKYLYVLFAIFLACDKKPLESDKTLFRVSKRKSRYVKK